MLTWHLFLKLILSKRAGSLIRRIAFLTSFSVFLSVVAFLVVLFVMNGMNESMRKRIMGIEPHLVITSQDEKLLSQLKQSDTFLSIVDDPSAKTLEYEKQDLIVKTIAGQFRGVVANGLTEESLNHFVESVNKHSYGNTSTNVVLSEQLPDQNEVIMGSDLARSLGVFEGDYISFVSPESLLLPVGSALKIEKLKVKSIFTTTLPHIDGQYVFYRKGSGLSRINTVVTIDRGWEIYLRDGYLVNKYKERFPHLEGVKLETWMERNSALFLALKIEKINIGVFLGLAGLIAGSSILTVLSLLISVKRVDIAMLKTLGMSESDTVATFTRLGILLSMSGVLLGILVGTGLSMYIEANPLNVLPDIYYDSEIPAKVDFSLVGLVLIVSSILSYFGSFIPASQTRKFEPAMLIRIKH